MGQNYSNTKKRVQHSTDNFVTKFLEMLDFDKQLGNSLLKSCVVKTKEGQPLICKVFNKSEDIDSYLFERNFAKFKEIKENVDLSKFPNVAPILELSYIKELVFV